MPSSQPMATAGEQPTPPPQIAQFEILEEIGRGAMGVVYRASDTKLERVVALKVLGAGFLATSDARKRFTQEARLAARMQHPGIVPVHEVGEENELAYYSMGLVTGGSLADLLREEGKLPVRLALGITLQVAEALTHAHELGVIHRDLKPGNLLLSMDDDSSASTPSASHGDLRNPSTGEAFRVVVADFGLAKELDIQSSLTVSGAVLGTPAYMSPEQGLGWTNAVCETSDLYSLSAVLYEMVTGHPVFEAGGVPQLLAQLAAVDPIPPRKHVPDLHGDVETMILKNLEKDSGQRYPSAAAFAADLRRSLEGMAIKAKPRSAPARARRWAWRHRGVVIPAGVLLVVAMIWGTVEWRRPGALTVEVSPLGAAVSLGDAQWESDGAAHLVELPAGLHWIDAAAPGHHAVRHPVEIERGVRDRLRLVLEPETGFLEIECDPRGAVVDVGGVAYGTPIRGLELATGSHELRVHRPGYGVRHLRVELTSGETVRRQVQLSRAEDWARRFDDWNVRHFEIGDIDADGAADLALHGAREVIILSGKSGETLSRRAVFPAEPVSARWIALDRDQEARALVALAPRTSGRPPSPVVVDAKTLEPVWWRDDLEVSEATPPEPLASFRTVSPHLGSCKDEAAGRIDLVLAGEGEIQRLASRDGATLWRRALPRPVRLRLSRRSPASDCEDLIVSAGTALFTLHGSSGEPRWQQEVGDLDWVMALGGRGELLCTGSAGTVRLRADTGEVIVRSAATIPAGCKVLEGDFLVVTREDGGLDCWDVRTAERLWHAPASLSPMGNSLDRDWTTGGQIMVDGAVDRVLWWRRGSSRVHSLRLSDGVLSHTVVLEHDSVPLGLGLTPMRAKASIQAALVDGNRLLLWRIADDRVQVITLPEEIQGGPTAIDMDGDRELVEVYVATRDGHVLGFEQDGRRCFASRSTLTEAQYISRSGVDANGLLGLLVVGRSNIARLVGSKLHWERKVGRQVRAGGLLEHVNDDGVPDVVIPVTDNVESAGALPRGVVALDGTSGQTVWASVYPQDLNHRLSRADLNGDGVVEIIGRRKEFPVPRFAVTAHDLRTGEIVTELTLPAAGYAVIGVHDLDGDGLQDLVVPCWDGSVVAAGGLPLRELWRATADAGDSIWCTPLYHDVDGDGASEVIVVSVSGTVLCLAAHDGAVVWRHDAEVQIASSLCLVPGRAGELARIAFGGADGDLRVLLVTDGSEQFRVEVDAHGFSTPICADVDGNGVPEILMGTRRGVVCTQLDGTVVWRAGEVSCTGPAIVGDLEMDGSLEVLAGSVTGLLCIEGASGEVRWRDEESGRVEGQVALADLDGDGVMEIVVGGSSAVRAVSGRGTVLRPPEAWR